MISRDFRIVFMGTPDFAVPSLQALLTAGYHVSAVVTAPDRPSGRGLKMRPSPVKSFAVSHELKVLQPLKLRDDQFLEHLNEAAPHLIVVVAFRMLPRQVWSMPPKGSINLHASLLPDYRGAAPIHWAVMNGETRTGLTTFYLNDAIDTGSILRQVEYSIEPDTTTGELHDALMEAGARLLVATVDDIRLGRDKAIPQDQFTLPAVLHPAPKLTRDLASIRWNMEISEVHNQVRGLSPSPGAYSFLKPSEGPARLIKVFQGRPHPATDLPSPGLISVEGRRVMVSCRNGWYELIRVQLEGKQPMLMADLLNGLNINNEWSLAESP